MLSHEEEGIRKGEIRPCKELGDLFDVLHGDKRRELVGRLAHSASSVATLATAMNLDEGDISYHLGKLWKCGLVEFEPIGATHIYRLTRRSKVSFRDTRIELTVTATNGDEMRLTYRLKYLESSQSIDFHSA